MYHHNRIVRSVASLAGALSLFVLSLALPAQASPTACEDGVSTRKVTFSVVLPDNNTYQMAGYFYWRGQLEGKVLQVALHGGSYNHKYWDAAPLNGRQYSYARYMACHGFSVLALDNLGVGESDKPDGDLVNTPVEADALHQIIQALRAGDAGTSFHKIVLVGHSMGSLQSIYAQGTYNDADALVVTGWENTPHQVGGDFGWLMATPYISMPPWMRTMLFYAGNFDPAMPDYDNATLFDQVPRGVFGYAMGAVFGFASSRSEGVRGPVLVVLNEYDLIMPASLAGVEPSTYPNASSVTTHFVPGIGHDTNLHPAGTLEWERIGTWIRQSAGGGSSEGDAG